MTGVQQFFLFIDLLCDKLRAGCKNGIFKTENVPDVFCFMFADDVSYCSDTIVKLQQQLNIVDAFCSETGIEVNMDKTEIIVFRNGGPLKSQ